MNLALFRAMPLGLIAVAAAGHSVNAQAIPSPTAATRTEWSFDEVITAATAQHPLVEAAGARIDAAQGARQTAGTLPNPVATYWIENSSFPGQRLSPGVDRETSTYLTLPLEPFFQRAPRMRQADEEIKAAEAGLSAARRQVALDAAHVFFRVALAQVSRDAAEENRAGLERLVTYNRSRVSEGATAEVDLIRTEVELDRAATNVTLAEVDLERSRAELWPFLGGTGPVPASFQVTLPAATAATIPLPSLNEFTERARLNRPELLATRARAAAAEAQTAYQRRLTIRQIGATFGVKRTAGANSMIAGISVPVPLFDRNRGEVQRAAGESIAAGHELAWTERVVAAEVQGAYDAAQRLSARITSLQPRFIDRATEANRITLAAYQEGAASLLQVLDAARTLADAKLTFYRAVFAQRQGAFDLALAAGDEPLNALAIVRTSQVTSSTEVDHKGGRR